MRTGSISTIIALTAWCFLHSFLIAPGVAFRLKKVLGRYFRIVYNAGALVTLVPVLYLYYMNRGPAIFAWEGLLAYARYLAVATGLFLLLAGARDYPMGEFIGTEQLRAGPAATGDIQTFQATGIHRCMRHPWYAAAYLLVWARDLSSLSIAVNGILSLYLYIGTLLEEKKLIAAFGSAYECYRETVPRYFPYRCFAKFVTRFR